MLDAPVHWLAPIGGEAEHVVLPVAQAFEQVAAGRLLAAGDAGSGTGRPGRRAWKRGSRARRAAAARFQHHRRACRWSAWTRCATSAAGRPSRRAWLAGQRSREARPDVIRKSALS